MRRIEMLVIHHSASGAGSVEVFRREHISKGWSDIAYHEVIGNGHGMPDGRIGQGRPHSKAGAGVYGANPGKLQVCLVGNFHAEDPGFTGEPTRKQWWSLGHWLAVNAVRFKVFDADKMVGHKEVTLPGHGTVCPGSAFPLDDVREWFDLNAAKFRDGSHETLASFMARLG
jgi:hypothetical protein